MIPPSAGPPPDARTASSVDKGHGRIETRTLTASTEAVGYLRWPGAAQILRIQRHRWINGKQSVDVAYAVTSLKPAEADPGRLLALWRDHWAIENRLHHVRDVSMNEDRCRVRACGIALANLRNATLTLIPRAGLNVRDARETFREDRAETIKHITGREL